jgi:hypothetical protein
MNYQNGKIYRIDCLTTGEVYIGSTCETTILKRLAGHLSAYNRYKFSKKNFVMSFQIIERNNYKISLIEHYPCNSKEELLLREGYYIRSIKCINKCIPGSFIKTKAFNEMCKKMGIRPSSVKIIHHK